MINDIRQAAAVEIFRTQVEGIADRMQDILLRSACSVVAREGMDCAAAIFLADGRVLAQARSLPLLLGGMIPAVGGLLRRFPPETMQAGDGFLQNDPWSGGTHLPDLIVAAPIRADNRTVAIAATILHHQDVGGMTPGSVPTDARDVFQEGLRLPPLRWRRGGEEDESVGTILRANSRAPDLLAGDLAAQWAAVTVGVRELEAALAASGPDAFGRSAERLLALSREAARAALARIADGTATIDDGLDGDGLSDDPVGLRVSVTKSGGDAEPRLRIDFSGSAAQTPGPINAVPSGLVAAAYALMRRIAPGAPVNDGLMAVTTLHLPQGSIVNPRFPAAVNARTATVKLACNAMIEALGRLDPAAGLGAPNAAAAVVLAASGRWSDGRPWFFTEIMAGGAGAGPGGPGPHGLSTDVSNARNVPVEVLEGTAPIRVEFAGRRRGSGGTGRHAGGDGVRRAYRLLAGEAAVTYRGERHRRTTPGAAGGGEGATASARIERSSGAIEALPSKARTVWHAGELLVIETAGGGGWGPAPEESRP